MTFNSRDVERITKNSSNSLESIFDEVVEFIRGNKSPEDIFSKSDLENWADDNGYVLEE